MTMSGKFTQYSWADIEKLIYQDMGLRAESEQRTKGEIWFVGNFSPPESPDDFILRVQVFDKTYSDRLKEHTQK